MSRRRVTLALCLAGVLGCSAPGRLPVPPVEEARVVEASWAAAPAGPGEVAAVGGALEEELALLRDELAEWRGACVRAGEELRALRARVDALERERVPLAGGANAAREPRRAEVLRARLEEERIRRLEAEKALLEARIRLAGGVPEEGRP